MTALAEAFVSILPDTSKMSEGIVKGTTEAAKAAEPAAKKGGESVGSNVGSGIHGGLSKWKGAIIGLTASLGVVGLAIEVRKFATESIDAYSNLATATRKLSTVTGASAEDSSRLISAFKMTGIAADQGTKLLGLFSKQIYAGELSQAKWAAGAQKAAAEHKKFTTQLPDAAAKFKDLGIEITDSSGKTKSMTDILTQTSAAFAKMPNGVDKAALAQKLFGRQGLAMLPFLNQGAAGVKKLMEESDNLGTTLSGKDLAAVKENTLAKRKFGEAMEGVAVSVGRVLFPALTVLASFMTEDLMPAVMAAGHWLGDFLGPIITKVAGWVTATLIPAVMNLVHGFQANVLPAIQTVGGIIAESLMPALSAIWETITTHIVPAIERMLPYFEKVAIVIGAIVAVIVIVVAKILEYLVPALAKIIDVVVEVVSHIARFASDAIDHFQSVVDFVKKVPGWMGAAFLGLADILTAPFRVAFDSIKTLWNSTLGGFKVHIPGIPGTSIGNYDVSIPRLAQGGIVPATPGGRLILAGEGGEAEAVVPLSKMGAMGGGVTVNVDARGADPAAAASFRATARQIAEDVVMGLVREVQAS